MLPEKNKWYRIQRSGETVIVRICTDKYTERDSDFIDGTAYFSDGQYTDNYGLYYAGYDWVELTDEERVAFILAN